MHHNWCIGTSAVCMCLGWDVEGLVKFYTVVPALNCVPFLLQDILQCNGIFFLVLLVPAMGTTKD